MESEPTKGEVTQVALEARLVTLDQEISTLRDCCARLESALDRLGAERTPNEQEDPDRDPQSEGFLLRFDATLQSLAGVRRWFAAGVSRLEQVI